MESALWDIVINVMIGYAIAKVLIWVFVRRVESQFDAELETLVTKVVDGMLIPVTVEVVDNLYLCYNTKTQEFVCQGINIAEISTNFKARYPEKKLALVSGDQKALDTLNTQLKELRNENSNSIGRTS